MSKLPGGLELRTAGPEDLAQIAALLVERGEPADALDHRLVVDDPDAGWDSCAVVVDGARVVSTATMLDETLHLGGVTLPAGQVELVATARDYEGRGLVRALMEWAHTRSAERGHLLQVMLGIPYFYRLFGYCYAVDIPRARPLLDIPLLDVPPGIGGVVLRPAGPADIPAVAALQDGVQGAADLVMPHSPLRQRWLLAHDGSTTWVTERAGTPIATARIRTDDDGPLVAEIAGVDDGATLGLLQAVRAQSGDLPVQVVERAGIPSGVMLGPGSEMADQYYLRIADPAALLTALQPLLIGRLEEAGLARTHDLVLSTFGAHYRVSLTKDAGVVSGGVLQGPASIGGAGVAPDQLPALLFGPLGMHGLCRLRPDVYPGPDIEMFEVLFPPVQADLLTYYLPY